LQQLHEDIPSFTANRVVDVTILAEGADFNNGVSRLIVARGKLNPFLRTVEKRPDLPDERITAGGDEIVLSRGVLAGEHDDEQKQDMDNSKMLHGIGKFTDNREFATLPASPPAKKSEKHRNQKIKGDEQYHDAIHDQVYTHVWS